VGKERVGLEEAKGGGEGGHYLGKAYGSNQNELSKANELVLVQPEGGLRTQLTDPLEEVGSL